jgi:hypothetical protein
MGSSSIVLAAAWPGNSDDKVRGRLWSADELSRELVLHF